MLLSIAAFSINFLEISKFSIAGILELPLNKDNKPTTLAFIGTTLIILLAISLFTMWRDVFLTEINDREDLLKDAEKRLDLDFSNSPQGLQTPIESTVFQNTIHSRAAFFFKSILPLLFGLSAIFICWESMIVSYLTLRH